MVSALGAAEITVVTHSNLFNNSWYLPYKDFREDQGHNVSVMQFSNGYTSQYIKQSLENQSPAPEYVLIVGDADEYPEGSREIVSSGGGNFIPFHYEIMAEQYHDTAAIATDDYYVSGISGAVIGRIPAESQGEINIWVDKLVNSSPGESYEDWRNIVLMITGDMDHPSNGLRGMYRDALRDTLDANYLSGNEYEAIKLNSKDLDPTSGGYHGYDPARPAAFEDNVNDGVAIIHAIGVGADESFLVNFYWQTPHPELSWDFDNEGQYPFLMGYSCSIGKVQAVDGSNQEYDSVMEKLLFLEDAGIIGAIAATWITDAFANKKFSNMFYDRITNEYYQDIGTALSEVKAEFEDEYHPYVWVSRATLLFGDPVSVLPLYQKLITLENMTFDATATYIAKDSITAGQNLTVEAAGDVTFRAGDRIVLKPGFTAEAGSQFHAYIDEDLGGGGLGKIIADVPDVKEIEEHVPEDENDDSLPAVYSLSHAYPNPFNPNITIPFGLPEPARTRLVVYDLLGREVIRLVDERRGAGYYQVVWQGRDAAGREIPSGVYIARLVTPKYTKSIKMLMLK